MLKRSLCSILDGLRQNAAARPHAPALLGELTLTYGALHACAGRIAARLQQAGVQPGARMAIWTRKGEDFICAIWGALEAGVAYVPLDPSQPSERAAKVLDEARPEVLVVAPDLFEHLPGALPDSLRLILFADGNSQSALPGLPMPADWLATLPEAQHQPFNPQPDTIATVLFTSGSTGTPKGVQLSHQNLLAFIGWAIDEFELCDTDVIANHASFHFDLSTFDLFASAQVGAAVWPIPTPQQSNIAAISEGLRRHGVTTLYAVPSILTMLARANQLNYETTPSLRRILFAGEVFPITDLQVMAKQVSADCALYNLYGPTETNVCTWYRLQAQDLEANHPVPIGQPLPGQSALILDVETGLPVKEGEKGELVIEGSLVTPGYLNVFDAKIQANHDLGRHATGDIVSRINGVLIYHGRIDRIVKIQGNRVELGEIEAALSRHPCVRHAAVINIQGPRGSDLVAFIACDADRAVPGKIELLNHLSQQLPRYMLPRHISIMPALPRTSNGKTDLRHLQRMAEDSILRTPQKQEEARAEP
jgi:L-proline---[L-prolyl-carrier protein] ligase